jgi:hypothetical protein
MHNVAVIVGTGPFGEDVLCKLPWIRHLDSDSQTYVISRIDPKIHHIHQLKEVVGESEFEAITNGLKELESIAKDFTLIYETGYLNAKYKESEIEKIQEDLGISLDFLLQLDYTYKDRDYSSRFHDQRTQILCCLVKFFFDYYSTNKINILINTLEDDIVSLAAHYTAKRMGIHCIGFTDSRFPRRGVLFLTDFTDPCIWSETSEDDFVSIKSKYKEKTITGTVQVPKGNKKWKYSSFPSKIPRMISLARYDAYIKKVRSAYPLEPYIFDDYNGHNFLKYTYQHLFQAIRASIIPFLVDDRGDSAPEKYFLYPFHYIYDAQMTIREPFLDQFDLIRTISKALPSGYKLYVKPHPHFGGSDINTLDLLDMKRLGNVTLVPPHAYPLPLILNSCGVISLNSTMGWESLIQNKPVITFGHDFYCNEELCHVVRDNNTLPQVMMDIIEKNHVRESNVIEDFVFKVYSNTIWTEGIDYEYGFVGLTDKDGEKIAKALDIIFDRS